MRCFIGIFPSKEVIDYIYLLQEGLKKEQLAKISWMHKSQIHFTLKFLGYVDEGKLDEINKRLAEIRYNSFNLSLDSLGWFPSANSIRVLWMGVEPEEKVIELQKIIDAKLLSILPGEQKFGAHLTLGRVKIIKNSKKFLDKISKIKIDKMEFNIDEYSLIKSQLTRDGPKYSIIQRYNLS